MGKYTMAPRLFVGDEELGKKDDEYRPGMKSPLGLGAVWQQRRVSRLPPRRTIKRLGLGLLGIIVLYYFFYNMPTDLGPPRQRPNYHTNSDPESHTVPTKVADSKPQNVVKPGVSKHSSGKEPKTMPHDFNGPIKFYRLAVSLHAVSNTRGSELINRNVVSDVWMLVFLR